MSSTHRKTIDLILNAVHNHVGEDGTMHSFLFSTEPGAPHWKKRFANTIFFSQKYIVEAALFVREHGPPYLQAMSIEDICKMLEDFLKDNFHDVGRETFFQDFTESYAKRVSESTKVALTQSLSTSQIYSPIDKLSLFPLVPVTVKENFTSGPFFLRTLESLYDEFDQDFHRHLDPRIFPPLKDRRYKPKLPNAWLGIRSPIIQASNKMKAVILGGLALTLPRRYRHTFSGREMFGGICTINNGTNISFGDVPHTPPLMHNLIIRPIDHSWLNILATKITSAEKEERRHLRALEYFYRAWPLGLPERFPVLCMTLDAIYGEASGMTKAIIAGVHSTLGTYIDERRLRLLLDIRASVIHGGAPDVYDSSKYRKYYQKYSAGPINDMDELVAESLRRRIFGTTINLQDDPNAEIISKMKADGKLPSSSDSRSILFQP